VSELFQSGIPVPEKHLTYHLRDQPTDAFTVFAQILLASKIVNRKLL
jgi:hypothetical protein